MIVSTNKLEPGMELGADVMNVNDMLLLGQGTVLTERHLHVLKMWGIDAVHVVGGQGDQEGEHNPADMPPEFLSAAEIRVNLRFRHVKGDSKRIQIVKKLAVRRAALVISQQRQAAATP
jgi:hypothetical protein